MSRFVAMRRMWRSGGRRMSSIWRPAIATAFVLALAPCAFASQAIAHQYVALQALANAPEPARSICTNNLDAYLAGSTGPDIALTTYLVAEFFEVSHPGAEAHYDRTGLLIMNMLNEAQKLQDPAQRDAGIAFALGWLTHYCTDVKIHALVNQFGGYYSAGHDFQVRHKHLESVECEHVLRKVGNPDRYVVSALAVPVFLITSAFHETFPEKSIYDPNYTLIHQYSFQQDLLKSAGLMSSATQFLVNVHNGNTAWTGPVFSLVFQGYPPTGKEYEKLIDPLTIDDVELEAPDRAAGETQAHLKITYTIEDLRLYKLWCQKWDRVIPTAVSMSLDHFNAWVGNPTGFRVFDRNLDTGGNIGSSFDTNSAWPGNPEIRSMLAYLEVKDKDGREIANWPAQGKWAPIVLATPENSGEHTGIIKQWEGWNKGKAGQCFIKIPFDATTPGPYDVKLRFAFADRQSGRLYGWPDEKITVEAEWEGVLGGGPELSVCFLVDCSGSMGGQKIVDAQNAVRQAVSQSTDGKTEWALLGFSSCTIREHCGFTMDPQQLIAAVDTLGAGGDTPLTYARNKAITYLTTRGQGKVGRLIVLCDGQDNCPERGGIRQEEAAASLQKVFRQVHEAQMQGNR